MSSAAIIIIAMKSIAVFENVVCNFNFLIFPVSCRIGCGEKFKFLSFKKWYLHLSPNMELITLELHLPNNKKMANLAIS